MTRCRREPVVPTAAATGPRRHDRRSPRARFGGSHDYEYSESVEVKRLKAEVKRLREDNEILRRASIFFAGELDPRNR